jgi:hypothetical protein
MIEHREATELLLAAGDTDKGLHYCDNAAAQDRIKAILAYDRALFR